MFAEELPLENASVKSPRFTLDGECLVFLQRPSGGPHAGAFALVKVAAPISSEVRSSE